MSFAPMALIVQGDGFYGVNIKILSPREIAKVKKKLGGRRRRFSIPLEEAGPSASGETLTARLVDIPSSGIFGFDSGLMEEGHALIRKLTK